MDNKTFFSELPQFLKIVGFFVKGDLIFLLPLFISILFLGFLSLKFMTIMIGVYIAVRNFGEMIYWFGHQFYERKYRPHDFGFNQLDNHAIYILYQTGAMATTVFGIGIVVAVIMFWK